MCNHLKSEVLQAFRILHRARKQVFNEDIKMLEIARNDINNNFKQNINENDFEKIKELIKVAYDAEQFLRKSVIQAKRTNSGTYKLKITDKHLSD